eukprot:341896_1
MGQWVSSFFGGEVAAPRVFLPKFDRHCVNTRGPQPPLPPCKGTFDKVPPVDCYHVAKDINDWREHINGHLVYYSDPVDPADSYVWIVMTDGSIRYFDYSAWRIKHERSNSIKSKADLPGHTSMLNKHELQASKVRPTSPVDYGGELYSGPDGKAAKITNFSGHLHPDPKYIKPIGTALGVPKIQEINSAYYGYYNLAPNPDNARENLINMLDYQEHYNHKHYANQNGYVGAGQVGNGSYMNSNEMVIGVALLMSTLLLLLILCIIGFICGGAVGYFSGKIMQKKKVAVLPSDYNQV